MSPSCVWLSPRRRSSRSPPSAAAPASPKPMHLPSSKRVNPPNEDDKCCAQPEVRRPHPDSLSFARRRSGDRPKMPASVTCVALKSRCVRPVSRDRHTSCASPSCVHHATDSARSAGRPCASGSRLSPSRRHCPRSRRSRRDSLASDGRQLPVSCSQPHSCSASRRGSRDSASAPASVTCTQKFSCTLCSRGHPAASAATPASPTRVQRDTSRPRRCGQSRSCARSASSAAQPPPAPQLAPDKHSASRYAGEPARARRMGLKPPRAVSVSNNF
mmetsp:Transcript_15702/g.46345  ORF Transcript_15702/g.46345 Transcript_15702/m.46345 type:complete len:273 (+) Transcript_15702:593-1411(+)